MNVLIVPGLHPRGCETLQRLAYSQAVSGWQSEGYSMHVQQFGWNDERPLLYRHEDLLNRIDDLPDNLLGIGTSAGGLALLAALKERPDKFNKVVTVASPLSLTEADVAEFRNNPLVPIPRLVELAYREVDDFLQTARLDMLAKIVSVHASVDNRVPTHWSRRYGVRSFELPVVGHGKVIMNALRRYRWKTQELLHSPNHS